VCILECDGGRQWTECGSCVRNCSTLFLACPAVCMVGCRCPRDRPVWQHNECITVDQCRGSNIMYRFQPEMSTWESNPKERDTRSGRGVKRAGVLSIDSINWDTLRLHNAPLIFHIFFWVQKSSFPLPFAPSFPLFIPPQMGQIGKGRLSPKPPKM